MVKVSPNLSHKNRFALWKLNHLGDDRYLVQSGFKGGRRIRVFLG